MATLQIHAALGFSWVPTMEAAFPFVIDTIETPLAKGYDLDDVYAWCALALGDTDAVTDTENGPGYQIDLNGVWAHLHTRFWFKHADHAVAFKMRWL